MRGSSTRSQESEVRSQKPKTRFVMGTDENLVRVGFRYLIVALVALAGFGCSPAPRDPQTVVMLIESSPLNLDPRIGTDA